MKEEILFQQMDFIRRSTLAALDATSEKQADEIPSGFKNSIRWNLGHILLSNEKLIFAMAGEQAKMATPKSFNSFFGSNTSPHTWEGEPPSLEELRGYLENQPKRISQTFTGRIDENSVKPFTLGSNYTLTTIAEFVLFANWHEGLHQGTITGIKRALGIENLWKK